MRPCWTTATVRSLDAPERDTCCVVIADPDQTCPGVWVEIDFEIGYCSLGDECRNPIPEAHQRRAKEREVTNTDDL